MLVIGRLEEFITRMRTEVGELDWNGRRDVIRALIRRIEIDHDDVDVVFRVPGRAPDGGPAPAYRGPLVLRLPIGNIVGTSIEASFGKIPTTSVRRLISPFSRSNSQSSRLKRSRRRRSSDSNDSGSPRTDTNDAYL